MTTRSFPFLENEPCASCNHVKTVTYPFHPVRLTPFSMQHYFCYECLSNLLEKFHGTFIFCPKCEIKRYRNKLKQSFYASMDKYNTAVAPRPTVSDDNNDYESDTQEIVSEEEKEKKEKKEKHKVNYKRKYEELRKDYEELQTKFEELFPQCPNFKKFKK